ncbi:hypothetical protein K432DRAFT_447942 [Lepidopterella palustris CBS 459.81]|uniref:Uncharacterized protein n=1 Tax=Lepidopterella palustris CBS 459.81 TaxID=1314670 RepID=A0A8E2J8F7_9PEZI|nr:hypothetical protein K432DRAFT_447942 [Lepidopterella palustris CBS 459.81]
MQAAESTRQIEPGAPTPWKSNILGSGASFPRRDYMPVLPDGRSPDSLSPKALPSDFRLFPCRLVQTPEAGSNENARTSSKMGGSSVRGMQSPVPPVRYRTQRVLLVAGIKSQESAENGSLGGLHQLIRQEKSHGGKRAISCRANMAETATRCDVIVIKEAGSWHGYGKPSSCGRKGGDRDSPLIVTRNMWACGTAVAAQEYRILHSRCQRSPQNQKKPFLCRL